MSFLQKCTDTVLQWFFPRCCPLCGDLLTESDAPHLCPKCELLLSADLAIRCPICHREASNCLCTPTLIRNTMTEIGGRYAAAVGFYRPGAADSPCNRLIHTVKHAADDTTARVLARMLSRELLQLFLKNGEDITEWIITYPPRIRQNRNESGVDQAQRLARFCAKDTGTAYMPLFQRWGGSEQKSLKTHARMENAESSLRLKKAEACQGKRFILCDDILTSGSTLSQCAALLRKAGAADVFVATVLVTIPKKHSKKSISDMSWFQ